MTYSGPAILGIICIAATYTQAQVMQRDSLVCDLTVNDFRIYWPPKNMSKEECLSMRQALKDRDRTKSSIICKCTVGDRS